MQKLQKKIQVLSILLLLSSIGVSTMSYGIFGFGESNDNKEDQNYASTKQEEEITDAISCELATQRIKQWDDFIKSQVIVMETTGKKWVDESNRSSQEIKALIQHCSENPKQCTDRLDDFKNDREKTMKKYSAKVEGLADELSEINDLKDRKEALVERYKAAKAGIEAARKGIQGIVESIGTADPELVIEINQYKREYSPQEAYDYAQKRYKEEREDTIGDIEFLMQKIELNEGQMQNIDALIKEGRLADLVAFCEKLEKEYNVSKESGEELYDQEDSEEN